jgi:hypothetical protein
MRRYLLLFLPQNYPLDWRKGTRSIVLHFTVRIDVGRAKSGGIKQENNALLLRGTHSLATPQLESFSYRKTLTEWYVTVYMVRFI